MLEGGNADYNAISFMSRPVVCLNEYGMQLKYEELVKVQGEKLL